MDKVKSFFEKDTKKRVIMVVVALIFVAGIIKIALPSGGSDDDYEYKVEKLKFKDNLTWPTDGLAVKLPDPGAKRGIISNNSSTMFSAYLADMPAEKFEEYVTKVKEKGFTTDFDQTDDSYQAKDGEGYSVDVSIEKKEKDNKIPENDVLYVSIHAPEKKEETKTEEKKTEESTPSTDNSSSVSADFKASMDSYETFFNKYVDFMNKYSKSTDPTGMMDEYNSLMTQYSDMTTKMNAIDSTKLSAADLKYYNEVMARINAKLATVGQ